MQYQIQEMLRTERIFEPDGIQQELDSYNPLIPDGTNLKATLLIEYTDPEQRRIALERLKGIETRCWLGVGDERFYAIADEDLEREKGWTIRRNPSRRAALWSNWESITRRIVTES